MGWRNTLPYPLPQFAIWPNRMQLKRVEIYLQIIIIIINIILVKADVATFSCAYIYVYTHAGSDG